MILPTKQDCPNCGRTFYGSDAVGDVCPQCKGIELLPEKNIGSVPLVEKMKKICAALEYNKRVTVKLLPTVLEFQLTPRVKFSITWEALEERDDAGDTVAKQIRGAKDWKEVNPEMSTPNDN